MVSKCSCTRVGIFVCIFFVTSSLDGRGVVVAWRKAHACIMSCVVPRRLLGWIDACNALHVVYASRFWVLCNASRGACVHRGKQGFVLHCETVDRVHVREGWNMQCMYMFRAESCKDFHVMLWNTMVASKWHGLPGLRRLSILS